MSHTVQIQTQVRDIEAVLAASQRLKLPQPVQGTIQLFGNAVTGLAVQLPGWNYPAVCQLDTGQIQFDNYGGAWGEQKELDRFVQAYAVEKARIEAHKRGHTVTEQPLTDGSIKLTIQVAGGAA